MSNVTKQAPIIELNWNDIDTQLDLGKLKLKEISNQLKISTADMKIKLIERYGETIVFKRGRKGGIFRKPS